MFLPRGWKPTSPKPKKKSSAASVVCAEENSTTAASAPAWKAKASGPNKSPVSSKSLSRGRDFEETGDLFGPEAFAFHAGAEAAVVEFSSAHTTDAAEDFFFGFGEVGFQPRGKNIFHAIRQSNDRKTRS